MDGGANGVEHLTAPQAVLEPSVSVTSGDVGEVAGRELELPARGLLDLLTLDPPELRDLGGLELAQAELAGADRGAHLREVLGVELWAWLLAPARLPVVARATILVLARLSSDPLGFLYPILNHGQDGHPTARDPAA